MTTNKQDSSNITKGPTRLFQALKLTPDEQDCQAVLDRLTGYVTTQLTDPDYQAQFPEIALHLDACITCAEAYARLYELELAVTTDTLPQPATVPEPDLGFLQQAEPEPLIVQLRQAVSRMGQTLTLRLSAELVSRLQPVSPASLTRAPADTTRYADPVLVLNLADANQTGFPAALTAYQDNQNPDLSLVEVLVEPEERSWPDLGGIRVTLTLAGQPHTAPTDAWGLAPFEGIPIAQLADMAIEITLA